MEFKGTYGTWTFAKWDGEEWPEKRWSVHTNKTAICISPRYFTEGDESEANGKLIAASPDLLYALMEIMRFKHELRYVMGDKLATPDNFLKALDEAEKAIKKAIN